MNPFVREMHMSNGLLDDIEKYGEPITDVEEYLTLALSHEGEPGDFILAGSGVSHFDRRFIEAQMPQLAKWLRYYNIDVGVLRRTLELCGRDDLLLPKQDKTHRALDDALLHLEELRFVRAALGSAS
jgi:oligoribonuclease